MIRNSRSGQAEIVIAVLIALGILVLAGTGIAPSKKDTVGNRTASPGAGQEETVDPLPAEGDTYYISGNGPGPKIYEATITPLGGVKPGVTQNWIVRVRATDPVNSVKVTVIMDNGSYPLMLRLSGGTNFDGVWRGSWEVKDDRSRIYDAIIEAEGGNGSAKVELSFPPRPSS